MTASSVDAAGEAQRRVVNPAGPEEIAGATWIDLLSPNAQQRSVVESATGLEIPTRDDVSEIESSSRLYVQNDALYMSTPIVVLDASGETVNTAIGFVLDPHHLVTVRFTEVPVLNSFAAGFAGLPPSERTSAHVLVGILEAFVENTADWLERIRGDLDQGSRRIFPARPVQGQAARSRELREVLMSVGRIGDLISSIRESLLGFARLERFLQTTSSAWHAPELEPRFELLRRDISSLSDYDMHLSNKAQFLLDAILGLINMDQSNIIKLMTVVGVVGVPPTLIASIYGMNFEHMPELKWTFGYPLAILAIVVSAILPLMWFRRKGWL